MSSEQPPVKRFRGKTAKAKAVDSASSSAAPTSLAPVPSLVGRLTRLPWAVADGSVRPIRCWRLWSKVRGTARST